MQTSRPDGILDGSRRLATAAPTFPPTSREPRAVLTALNAH